MTLRRLLPSALAVIASFLMPAVVEAAKPPLIAPVKIGTATFKFIGTWIMSAEGDADDYWLYFTRPEGRSEDFKRDEDDLYGFQIEEEGEWTVRIGVEEDPDDCGSVVLCNDAHIVSVEERQPGVFYISVRKPADQGVEAIFIFRGSCATLLPPSDAIIPGFTCPSDVCLFTWGLLASCTGSPIASFVPLSSHLPAVGSGLVARKPYWHESDQVPLLSIPPECDYFQPTALDAFTPFGVTNGLNSNSPCGFRTGVASMNGRSRGLKELKAHAGLRVDGYAKAAADATTSVADDGQMVYTLAGAADVLFFNADTANPNSFVAKFTYQITGQVKEFGTGAEVAAGSYLRGAGAPCAANNPFCSVEFEPWDGPAGPRNVPFEFEFKPGFGLLTGFELVAAVVAASDPDSTELRHSADVTARFDSTARLVRIQLFEGTIDNLGLEIQNFTIESESGEDYNVLVDTTPPVTTPTLAGTLGTNGWYRSAVSVALAATDGGAGVLGSFIGVDGAVPAAYTGPAVIAADGLHNVAFYSADAAGNIEPTNTITLRIDTTAPAVTPPAPITVQATEAAGARPGNTPALATFVGGGSATDAQDGAPIKLPPTLGGATIEGTTLFTLGVNVVSFEFTDAAGNTGAATATVTVTAPAPPPATVCDADGDEDVDVADLQAIRQANGLLAKPGDVRDGNQDGRINVADLRYCQLRLTSIQ